MQYFASKVTEEMTARIKKLKHFFFDLNEIKKENE